MKTDRTCQYPNQSSGPVSKVGRRQFLRNAITATVTAPFLASLEEHALMAKEAEAVASPSAPAAKATLATGRIGKVPMGRLICGGNLISGYAHSRDLIYVSSLLKQYFTEDKIMETWSLCEQHGINTMILYPESKRELELYKRYRARGGTIQFLAQVNPTETDVMTCVKEARDAGAAGAFLLGNISDQWTREGKVGLIGQLIANIKQHGMISGVAGHELRSVKLVEEAKGHPDFYMKTLHPTDYWSARRPDQTKEVIDNYSVDNYWCMDPQETIAYMSELNTPWIAYKVLAAGAVHPRAGFKFAFENGADFAAVGLFDFQIAEDVALANKAVAEAENRQREWVA